jgi:adenine-specific DNA methylase
MTDFPRLIEHAFPLKQASLDSVHEKNVRHGHISTLHIWPARRPLAACRAALIATLLPDPGTPEGRKELCEKIGGRVVKRIEKKKMPGGQVVERVKEETEGGILHWGRETENAETLNWFRQEIRKAYGGRAPKVLDPFAGGGAIPLEAMRLGCEATAVDINPVAWFILKCTLEYPQKLAGQTRPLPEFILRDDAFMAEFFKKAKGYSKAETAAALKRMHGTTKKKAKASAKADDAGLPFGAPEGPDEEIQADLAWHVRAWGQWVLARARKELAQYYPTYADFEPIKKDHVPYERQPMRLVPLKEDGTPDIDSLNAEFTKEYLEDKRNPRWVAKPTVAYLWARTVTCKNCRATVPLLRTLWLSKEASCRKHLEVIVAETEPRISFGIIENAPQRGGNNAARREHDKRVGQGTMTRSGVRCPCCQVITSTDDIQHSGKSDKLGDQLVAVVVASEGKKTFRLPQPGDHRAFAEAKSRLATLARDGTFAPLTEPIDSRRPSPNSRGLSGLTRYGIDSFGKVFNPRQQLSLFTVCDGIRRLGDDGTAEPSLWRDAICDYLALVVDKLADYNSAFCTWHINRQTIGHTFARYALPMTSDYAESVLIGGLTGGWQSAVTWTCMVIDHLTSMRAYPATIHHGSATDTRDYAVDLILTDPPYYDSIPYADISDFFYVWLRRCVGHRYAKEFRTSVVDRTRELIQHAGRLDGDNIAAKKAYEDGMALAFQSCAAQLTAAGRLVVVFAHKMPDAWETLASSIIRAGFTVDASWPVQTEMPNKAAGGARLASSIWMVCKKRSIAARPGWDNRVLEEMRANISVQLREFWDAGIRGPDFVWAATGPALEAYSKHPVVRKANEPNATMSVGEFLTHVRRMVVDYVVGQVLSGEKGADLAAADRLDEVTAYYLLHRHDFGMEDAPVGACILYATACGLSDAELERSWDILVGAGGGDASADDLGDDDDAGDEDGEADADAGAEGGGSKVKLKTWSQRKGKSLGFEAPEGKAVPLIDRVHRLMHLWKDGDLHKVDEYIDEHSLRRNELFKRVVQSLIELSSNSERSLLESISNHIGAKGAVRDRGPELFTTKAGGERE